MLLESETNLKFKTKKGGSQLPSSISRTNKLTVFPDSVFAHCIND